MNKLLPEEREKWHHLLSEKLGDGYDFDLINKKLDECEKGWGHAPKTIEDRIQAKFFKKPPSRTKQIIEFEDGDDPIFPQLSTDEIEYWRKRRKSYIDDFAFNLSSDESLIRQVLFEEIINNRCMAERLKKGFNQEIEDRINNSSKRLADALKNLGINRGKRTDILDKEGGDIASLSASLDKKLAHIKIQNKNWEDEEAHYMAKKNEKEPQNILPPMESLKDESFITDIINVSPEIKREEQTKEKPVLPTGSNLKG